MVLSVKGKNNRDGNFNWHDAVVDALIMAGLTFFTALGGLGATGALMGREVLAAGIAAGTQFCLTLAIKRGLRPKQT